MRKPLLTVISLVFAFMVIVCVLYFSSSVKINSFDVYKIEIYKHSEKIQPVTYKVEDLKRSDLIMTIRGIYGLKSFKINYDNLKSYIISADAKNSLRSPDYDIVLYTKASATPHIIFATVIIGK